MNKSIERAVIFTTLTCSAVVAVGLSLLNSKSFDNVASATLAVPHSVTFTYEDITLFMDDGGECITEVSKTTEAGNTFRSTDFTITNTYQSQPEQGDENHNYIVKVYQPGWEYEYLDSSNLISIEFEMNLDIAAPITAVVNRTIHYHNGASESDSTKSDDIDYLSDDDKLYYLFYNFAFDNKYYEYVTINYIQISYSCSY